MAESPGHLPPAAGPTPALEQINLIVADMDRAVAFYRRLGLDMPDAPEWPAGTGARHAEVEMPGSMRLELDNREMAALWHCGPVESAGSGAAVVGLSVAARDEVDRLYGELTAAGHPGTQPPYDAFWGARYAIVEDPDGHRIGLMGPIDPERRYVPTGPPPGRARAVRPGR